MASTYQLSESNGATPTVTDIGANGTTPPTTDWGYKLVDTYGPPAAGEEVIREGIRSYVKHHRSHHTGTFTLINNILTWISDQDLSLFGTGAKITGSVPAGGYTQCTNNNDTGDGLFPSTYSAALDITPTGGLAAPGYSKYFRHQLTIGTDAVPSIYADKYTLNISWDEI